jgi:hypothetical protein
MKTRFVLKKMKRTSGASEAEGGAVDGGKKPKHEV